MQQFPIFLNLAGRTVLIVGEGDAADAKARLANRAGARIVKQWEEGTTIAFVALEDESEAAAAAQHLRAKGLLVNVVDRPHLCDFTTPAIIDRAPITIAVGTAGTSAGLAKAIRQRIEAMLPHDIGSLASALHAARAAIKSRWPSAADRRRALDAAMASGGPLDPTHENAAHAIPHWLENAENPAPNRAEQLRITSPNPDDLSLRIARLLGEADHIFHSPALPHAILNRARADAQRHISDGPPASPPAGLSLWLSYEADGEAADPASKPPSI